jgi:hypothetical protein
VRETDAQVTSPDLQRTGRLEVHGGIRRLRLTGRRQIARQTRVSADLGGVRIDLTDATFDDHVIDLHVYTAGETSRSSFRTASPSRSPTTKAGSTRLEPPVPGVPLIRLDVTINIGTVHLRHPAAQGRTPTSPGFKRR